MSENMSEDNEVIIFDWIKDLDPLSDDIFDCGDNHHEADTTKSTNHPQPSEKCESQGEIEKSEKRKSVSFEDAEKRSQKRSRSSSRNKNHWTSTRSLSREKSAGSSRQSRSPYREPRKRSLSRDHRHQQRNSRQPSREYRRSPYRETSSKRTSAATASSSNHETNQGKLDWDSIAIKKINFKEEEHYAIVDFFVSKTMLAKATSKDGQIHFDSIKDGTINDLANAVSERIQQAKQTSKRTYITASIFNRHFERLGRDGVIAITKEIAELIPMDRRGYSKIRLTFSTITYAPSLQHRWQEIQEANYFLKQVTHALGSAPLNGHKWTLTMNRYHTKRREVMAHCFEEYNRKTGLGHQLSLAGTEKVAKAIIMHHTSGVREITGQNFDMEPAPVHLNITPGYKLPDNECNNRELVNERRWLFSLMGAIEGKTQLAKKASRQTEGEFKSIVKQAIEEIIASQLERQGIPIYEKEQTTMEVVTIEDKADSIQNIQLKDIIKEQENKIAELESQVATFNDCREDFKQALMEETNKTELLQRMHNKETSHFKRQIEDLMLQRSEKQEPDDRAQKKIDRLENKVAKLQKDLRDEQDDNARDMEEAKDEIKSLKSKIRALEYNLKVEKELNKALKEKQK